VPGTNPRLPEPPPNDTRRKHKYSPRIEGLPRRRHRRAKALEVLPHPLQTDVLRQTSRDHSNLKRRLQSFDGAVIDTGASKSIIGISQAKAYCYSHQLRHNSQPSTAIFRFADQICSPMGRIKISIPTPDATMDVWVDIVQAEVPLLLGLDAMSRNGLNVLIATDE
jgi:hypothetical protein